MPDPKAGMRLLKLGCEVKFEKGIKKEPVVPKSPEELDAEGKAKLKSHDVWFIDITMPRKLVDEFKDEEVNIGGANIDTEELNNAYEGGLDDDTNKNIFPSDKKIFLYKTFVFFEGNASRSVPGYGDKCCAKQCLDIPKKFLDSLWTNSGCQYSIPV